MSAAFIYKYHYPSFATKQQKNKNSHSLFFVREWIEYYGFGDKFIYIKICKWY